jgi:hypothetical protein
MATMLEVEVPQEVFSNRIQPFGIALAEVSWRMKMFSHDGVVLAALYLEEPSLIIVLSFGVQQSTARRLFKGAFEICLYCDEIPNGRVRLEVRLDASTVEELFVAANLINPHPSRTSVRRAERHFTEFLAEHFPEARVTWARALRWKEKRRPSDASMPIRVG